MQLSLKVTSLIWKILFVIQFLCFENVNSTDNFSKQRPSAALKWNFDKRPFCNAFTGCGRKRSPSKIESPEVLSELIDMNAEPAVGDVQRQIMSQAKIFEALREANKEILFQNNNYDVYKDESIQN